MAAKLFEVGDVLPAGIIKMDVGLYNSGDFYEPMTTVIFNDTNWISFYGSEDDGQDVIACVGINTNLSPNYVILDDSHNIDEAWYERRDMYAEIIIDFSNCSLSERTVTSIEVSSTHGGINPTWEVVPSSGYSITFEENGGSTVTDLSERTALPNPLPTPTKPGYTFGGWYYESNFQTRAKAGDTIEANTTLYAKWLTLAQVLEHINNVVEELRSAIINKGGDAEGKLLIDFAAIINSLKTYEVVETLAELELLEPTLNRIVYVVEGSGELTMGAPVKVTQDGDTLIIG